MDKKGPKAARRKPGRPAQDPALKIKKLIEQTRGYKELMASHGAAVVGTLDPSDGLEGLSLEPEKRETYIFPYSAIYTIQIEAYPSNTPTKRMLDMAYEFTGIRVYSEHRRWLGYIESTTIDETDECGNRLIVGQLRLFTGIHADARKIAETFNDPRGDGVCVLSLKRKEIPMCIMLYLGMYSLPLEVPQAQLATCLNISSEIVTQFDPPDNVGALQTLLTPFFNNWRKLHGIPIVVPLTVHAHDVDPDGASVRMVGFLFNAVVVEEDGLKAIVLKFHPFEPLPARYVLQLADRLPEIDPANDTLWRPGRDRDFEPPVIVTENSETSRLRHKLHFETAGRAIALHLRTRFMIYVHALYGCDRPRV